MASGWLWHPNRQVNQVPLSADYRCCCGACTSSCGFTFCTILSLILYALFGIFLLFIYLMSGPVGWIMCLGSISLIVFALLAICSSKPIYMQLYMIVLGIIHGLYILAAIISSIYRVIHWDTPVMTHKTHWRVRDGQADDLDRFKDFGEMSTPSFAVVLAGVIIEFILLLLVIAWYWTIVYSYYAYLRDKLLHEEQHGVNVGMKGYGGNQPQVIVHQNHPGYPNSQPATNPNHNWKAQ